MPNDKDGEIEKIEFHEIEAIEECKRIFVNVCEAKRYESPVLLKDRPKMPGVRSGGRPTFRGISYATLVESWYLRGKLPSALSSVT